MNEIPIDVVLKENIKRLRKRLGWSQEFLAEKAGVSAPFITQIETGKRKPSLEIIQNMAFAFGVEYKTLFEPQSPDNSANETINFTIIEQKVIAAVNKAIHDEFNVLQ